MNNNGNMVFAKRIKKLREMKKESQEEIAKLAGYKKQAVSHWEIKGKVPRAKVLRVLAEHFATSSDYLLGIDNNADLKENKRDLSHDEVDLLRLYRRMDEDQKTMLQKVAENFIPPALKDAARKLEAESAEEEI